MKKINSQCCQILIRIISKIIPRALSTALYENSKTSRPGKFFINSRTYDAFPPPSPLSRSTLRTRVRIDSRAFISIMTFQKSTPNASPQQFRIYDIVKTMHQANCKENRKLQKPHFQHPTDIFQPIYPLILLIKTARYYRTQSFSSFQSRQIFRILLPITRVVFQNIFSSLRVGLRLILIRFFFSVLQVMI